MSMNLPNYPLSRAKRKLFHKQPKIKRDEAITVMTYFALFCHAFFIFRASYLLEDPYLQMTRFIKHLGFGHLEWGVIKAEPSL